MCMPTEPLLQSIFPMHQGSPLLVARDQVSELDPFQGAVPMSHATTVTTVCFYGV